MQMFTAPNVLAGILTYAALSFIVSVIWAPRYPTLIPWAGHGHGWLASVKNTFAAFVNSGRWLQDGYDTHNKNGKSFVLPRTIGFRRQIVVPPSQIPWLLEQSDSVLSTSMAYYDSLYGDYSQSARCCQEQLSAGFLLVFPFENVPRRPAFCLLEYVSVL